MATEVKNLWAFPTHPFGEPTLTAINNSDAVWSRGILPTTQKGSTGWYANLYGGVQTDDDYAAINIPVDELRLPDFATAKWSYYMTSIQTMGVNIVIWVHDPTDFDNRAEITQLGSHADLGKAAGRNAFEFSSTTGGMFYYGENISGSDLNAGAGNQYTWSQFITDALFKTWKIYRISFEHGWEASGTFDDVWVQDIKLNNQIIPLKPDSGGSGRIGHRYYFSTDISATHTLAPKTPFRLLSIDCEINPAGTADESLTIRKNARIADTYDTLIFSQNTKTPAITSLFVPFGEGYDFPAGDELDMSWNNAQSVDFGFTWTYQTVF